jgi:predicted lactoylglutathione lyase
MVGSGQRLLFVNLPVADLRRAVWFFRQLGFDFDPRFTDERAACMVVAEHAFVVLLTQPFFRAFIRRDLCDRGHAEGVVRVSCARRAQVDGLVERAVAAGGRGADAALDQGYMYSAGFFDLDDHHWQVAWLNPNVVEA